MAVRRVWTSGGLELTVSDAAPGDHDELYAAFAQVVAAGEGYPQPRGPLAVEDFREYWIEHKSAVVVARHRGAWPAPTT